MTAGTDPKERIPGRGWKRTTFEETPIEPYSDADLQRLVGLLPLSQGTDLAALHRELQDWARFYLLVKQNFDAAPRPASQRASLTKLRVKWVSARQTLQALDDESRGRLERAVVNDSTENTSDAPEGFSTALTLGQIEGVIGKIDISLKAIPDSWPQKGARPLFIMALAMIWFNFTGTRPRRRHNPYAPASEQEYGPFRNFVVAALEALDPEEARHGLDDGIRDAALADSSRDLADGVAKVMTTASSGAQFEESTIFVTDPNTNVEYRAPLFFEGGRQEQIGPRPLYFTSKTFELK